MRDLLPVAGFPVELAAWRRRMRFSEAQAAEVIGCGVGRLRRWESGTEEPKGNTRTTVEIRIRASEETRKI